MAFPSTGILDDFNRASLGANWTALAGYGAPRIASNQFAGGGAVWNPARYGPDCEAFVTVTALDANFGVLLRIANPAGSATGYYVEGNDSGYIAIYRVNGGVTLLGTRVATSWAVGDQIGATAVGSRITAYRRPAAGAWTEMTSQVDATYSAAGFIGAYVDGTGLLDNFGGGTVVPDTGPTVWRYDGSTLARCTIRDSTGSPVRLAIG